MKIYFAGNVTIPREKILIRLGGGRLFSFYYHGKGKEFKDEFLYRIDNTKIDENENENLFCSG